MKIKDGLVVEALADGGALILDESTKMSHALKPDAAAVWRAIAAGATEVPAIAAETGQDAGMVAKVLAELEAADLLELAADPARRRILAQAATVAGAAAGLKLIESIATPTPAQAQSIRTDTQNDGDA